jgi:hypothetical protein
MNGSFLKNSVRFFFHSIAGTISITYNFLFPSAVRKFITPIAKKCSLALEIAVLLFYEFRSGTYILSGKSKYFALRVLYIGHDSRLSAVTQLTGMEAPTIKKEGGVYIWDIPGKIASFQTTIDMAVVEVNPLFAGKAREQGFLLIPEWVSFVMKTPGSIKGLTSAGSRSLKNNMRRVSKNGYSYEICRDFEKLSYFYREFYVPYVSRRHADLAYLNNFPLMKRLFRTGAILFVKLNDEYVAGNLLTFKDDTVLSLCVGIKDDHDGYRKKGALSALNYFIVMWAIQQRYTTIDFGLSRACLNDGVFRYKRSWGMMLRKYEGNSKFFGLKVYRFTEGVEDFLEKNPLVFYRNGELEGLVTVRAGFSGGGDIDDIVHNYSTRGLTRLNLLYLSGCPPELKSHLETKYRGVNLVTKDFLGRHE